MGKHPTASLNRTLNAGVQRRGDYLHVAPDTLQEAGPSITAARTRTRHLNHRNVSYERNAGLPKGGDPQGNGDPVVVRARESLVHGEGGQVSQMDRKRRYA
jgi:hypothetical protein